jgi:hypothetical protein
MSPGFDISAGSIPFSFPPIIRGCDVSQMRFCVSMTTGRPQQSLKVSGDDERYVPSGL